MLLAPPDRDNASPVLPDYDFDDAGGFGFDGTALADIDAHFDELEMLRAEEELRAEQELAAKPETRIPEIRNKEAFTESRRVRHARARFQRHATPGDLARLLHFMNDSGRRWINRRLNVVAVISCWPSAA